MWKRKAKPCNPCNTDRPPVASSAKDGKTLLLWSCDHCPAVWVEEISGEWTPEQIQEAGKFPIVQP